MPNIWVAPFLFELDEELELGPVFEPELGALGVNVAEGFDTHELATEAADTDEDAWLFTVAFPSKLHDCTLRFVAS